jgi:transcriptional regulator with XRE-family HTH domain
MNLIDSLVATRKGRKFSQAELAKRSGVGLSTIENIESRRNSPTLETVNKLARALGCCLVLANEVKAQ